jgi:hypothetical protein
MPAEGGRPRAQAGFHDSQTGRGLPSPAQLPRARAEPRLACASRLEGCRSHEPGFPDPGKVPGRCQGAPRVDTSARQPCQSDVLTPGQGRSSSGWAAHPQGFSRPASLPNVRRRDCRARPNRALARVISSSNVPSRRPRSTLWPARFICTKRYRIRIINRALSHVHVALSEGTKRFEPGDLRASVVGHGPSH